MNEGVSSYKPFQFQQKYSAMFFTTGLNPTINQGKLAASTYPGASGLFYRTGSIVALNPGGELVNCDPAAGDSTANAVGIILDDRLPVSDEVGTGVVGNIVNYVAASFRVQKGALVATLANFSDVDAAMTAVFLNARYISNEDAYSVF